MSIAGAGIALLNSLLRRADAALVRRSAWDTAQTKATMLSGILRDKGAGYNAELNRDCLPPGANEYLRPDNPRLLELRKRYAEIDQPMAERSFWSNALIEAEVDLRYFRADSAYVWQSRDFNAALNYLLAAYYVQKIDSQNLLQGLTEDGLFGAWVHSFNDEFLISRDLLDSIVEIYFLERHLQISSWPGVNILDVGAGYGRLAHRMVTALPNIGSYFCVDSVPESTFLSEYYLKFREVNDRARVVTLWEIEQTLTKNKVDVALNIHSFTECGISAIAGWLDLLQRYRVRYLVIIPNGEDHQGSKLLSRERDNNRIDFLGLIQEKGYDLIAHDPKYLDSSVQQYGPSATRHYLFELIR